VFIYISDRVEVKVTLVAQSHQLQMCMTGRGDGQSSLEQAGVPARCDLQRDKRSRDL
jgi:hypothetical protein